MAGEAALSVWDLQQQGAIFVEDGNHGEYRPLPHEFVPTGVAFIRAADLAEGRVLFESCEHITAEAAARVRKGVGAPNDIILSHKGTVGKLAMVGANAPSFVCSPQTTIWRVLDTSRIDRSFLYAYMRSTYFINQLRQVQGETDMAPYVSLTAQRQFRIPLPEIVVQRAIGDLIGSLDDKIELNLRMAATLEEMAQALFKRWFVYFDPVRAKVEGRDTGLPAATAAMFPDAFGDDGLPVGWQERPFGDVFEIRNGNTPSTEEARYWGGNHYWATPKDLSPLKSPVLLVTDRTLTDDGVAVVNSGLLPPGSVLISTRAPIGYLAFATCPVAINQGMAGIVGKELSTAFAWLWCSANIDTFLAVAGGSTFPEISKGTLRKLPMVLPTANVSEAFAACVDPIVARLIELARESDRLAELRDTLLPRLISGELQIKGGAAQGEAA